MDINSDIVTTEFEKVDFDDLMDILTKEIELKNYRIIRVINIDNVKTRKNLVKDLVVGFVHYKIIEFCNLFSCNEIVSADLRAGVFMPQRFAVYQPLNDKSVYVSYLKPTAFAGLFESKRMLKTAIRLDKEMRDVVEASEP